MHVHIELTQPIAEAWLQRLRSELREGFQQHWYDDKYRDVPVGMRSARILQDYPALAGHKKTIGVLQVALKQAEQRT